MLKGDGREFIFYEEVEVGFFPSFEMWKEEGKGVIFSLQFFFHCGIAEEGKGFFFLQIHYVGRGWL